MAERLLPPQELRKRLLQHAYEVLSGRIELYNYNLRETYRTTFEMLDVELNGCISRLIDTHATVMCHVGRLMISESLDTYGEQQISSLTIKTYLEYRKKLYRRLAVIRVYLHQLGTTLFLRGWGLVRNVLLSSGILLETIVASVPTLSHRIEATATVVEYLDHITSTVLDPIINRIVEDCRDINWLRDHLFCSSTENPEDILARLDTAVRNRSFTIYRRDKRWFRPNVSS